MQQHLAKRDTPLIFFRLGCMWSVMW